MWVIWRLTNQVRWLWYYNSFFLLTQPYISIDVWKSDIIIKNPLYLVEDWGRKPDMNSEQKTSQPIEENRGENLELKYSTKCECLGKTG